MRVGSFVRKVLASVAVLAVLAMTGGQAMACGVFPTGFNSSDGVVSLVANGSNQIAYTSQANAGASRQGMLFYNRTTNSLYVCDGSVWRPLMGRGTDAAFNPAAIGTGLYGGQFLQTSTGTNDNATALTFGYNSSGSVGTTPAAGIYVQTSASYGSKMYFGTTNSYGSVLSRMMIDHAGFVGIGTNVPKTKLHIADSAAPMILDESDQVAATGYWRIVADGGAYRIDQNTSAARDLVTYRAPFSIDASGNVRLGGYAGAGGGNETVYVGVNNGNVGIGSAAPNQKLVVQADNATAGVGNTSGQVSIQGNTDPNMRLILGYNTTSNYGWIQAGQNGTAYRVLALNDQGGSVGIATSTPRSVFHVVQPSSTNQYAIFQGVGAGGTALTSTDTIPIASSNGFIGYNGIALIPGRWGNATTVDAHNVVYLGGAQRNNGATSSTLAFANWGYFTGTSTAAGGLGNATAQGDAVKFTISLEDGGAEFTQRLAFKARSATGTNVNPITVLSNGNVGILNTSPSYALDALDSKSAGFVMRVRNTANTSGPSGILLQAGVDSVASGAALIQFQSPNGTNLGSITQTGTGSAAYNTTSDRRLKENIVPASNGLERLLSLPVVDFNFIGDPAKKKVEGFIAQDVYKVFPDAVTTHDDGEKPLAKGETPWAMDYGRITPMIVKAVQELSAKNDALATENAALKGQLEALDARLKALESK
ncbi:MAG: tail fiber domain-containing protein [Alphaproteobacteria bacterium]|nr:tail fiber domain-containing protein [Alphaproteobacteria bacterium]